jgi:hypothetical protein
MWPMLEVGTLMDKYTLEAVRVRLKHTKTEEQAKAVIDSYPDLKGMSKAEVWAMTDINTDQLKGRPLGYTRGARLERARKLGWGKR